MKHLVIATLDNVRVTEDVLKELSHAGYNGSVIASTSLKHTLTNGGDIPMFVNLSHFESDKYENNTIINIVVEEEQIDDVLNIIREKTKKFTLCHGGMYVTPLERYEGSF